jgi:hypothetical protein
MMEVLRREFGVNALLADEVLPPGGRFVHDVVLEHFGEVSPRIERKCVEFVGKKVASEVG